MASPQIGEYTNKGKYSLCFNLKTYDLPDTCQPRKPTIGTMDFFAYT